MKFRPDRNDFLYTTTSGEEKVLTAGSGLEITMEELKKDDRSEDLVVLFRALIAFCRDRPGKTVILELERNQ